jgi:hypothetical protein
VVEPSPQVKAALTLPAKVVYVKQIGKKSLTTKELIPNVASITADLDPEMKLFRIGIAKSQPNDIV